MAAQPHPPCAAVPAIAMSGASMASHTPMRKSLPVVLSGQALVELDLEHEEQRKNAVVEQLVSNYELGQRSRSRAMSEQSADTRASTHDSTSRWAEPQQTLIFLDWDNTLFPTSELVERQGLHISEDGQEKTPLEVGAQLQEELARWSEAVHNFLSIACAEGGHCAVVTNSRRPWVDSCLDKFAPHLLDSLRRHDTLRVVYADEVEQQQRKHPSTSSRRRGCGGGGRCASQCAGLLRLLSEPDAEERQLRQRDARLTAAKLAAMRQEATEFYSRYPGQTWKNILCIGDMQFEHDAVRELASNRSSECPRRERLRTKTVLTPRGLSVSELTLQLELASMLLPAYVRFNGSFDLKLAQSDPFSAIATTLRMPQLRSLPTPCLAPFGWLHVDESLVDREEEAVETLLANVQVVVHDWLHELAATPSYNSASPS